MTTKDLSGAGPTADPGVESAYIRIVGPREHVIRAASASMRADLGTCYRCEDDGANYGGRIVLADGVGIDDVILDAVAAVDEVRVAAPESWDRLCSRVLEVLLHRRPDAAVSRFDISDVRIGQLSDRGVSMCLTI